MPTLGATLLCLPFLGLVTLLWRVAWISAAHLWSLIVDGMHYCRNYLRQPQAMNVRPKA